MLSEVKLQRKREARQADRRNKRLGLAEYKRALKRDGIGDIYVSKQAPSPVMVEPPKPKKAGLLAKAGAVVSRWLRRTP